MAAAEVALSVAALAPGTAQTADYNGKCGTGFNTGSVRQITGGSVGAVALTDDVLRQAELMRRRRRRVPPPQSGFAGSRFPHEVIVLAVRWYLRYLRYGLSYRNVEKLLAERGIAVDPRDRVPLDATVHPATLRVASAASAPS